MRTPDRVQILVVASGSIGGKKASCLLPSITSQVGDSGKAAIYSVSYDADKDAVAIAVRMGMGCQQVSASVAFAMEMAIADILARFGGGNMSMAIG